MSRFRDNILKNDPALRGAYEALRPKYALARELIHLRRMRRPRSTTTPPHPPGEMAVTNGDTNEQEPPF